MVDASWHGVPQRRKRLIIIGFRRDLAVRMDHILAIEEALAGSPVLRKYPLTSLEALEGATLPELRDVYREIVAEYNGLFSGNDPVDDYLRLHKGDPRDPLFDQALEEHRAAIRLLGWEGTSLTVAPRTPFRTDPTPSLGRGQLYSPVCTRFLQAKITKSSAEPNTK